MLRGLHVSVVDLNLNPVIHLFVLWCYVTECALLVAVASDGMRSKRKCISCREYYCYLFQIRKDSEGMHHLLLDCERITQQFFVDMYVKLENTRLDFFRNNQGSIRADLYQGVVDVANEGEESAANVGH